MLVACGYNSLGVVLTSVRILTDISVLLRGITDVVLLMMHY